MSCPRGHRHKLVGAVGRVLRVHNLGEKEAREGGSFGEQGTRRDGRPKYGHILRSGDGNAENRERNNVILA